MRMNHWWHGVPANAMREDIVVLPQVGVTLLAFPSLVSPSNTTHHSMLATQQCGNLCAPDTKMEEQNQTGVTVRRQVLLFMVYSVPNLCVACGVA